MGEHLHSLRELARAPRPRAAVGGKAASLARLVAAGLPVPDGVVVPAGAPAPDPDVLAELGPRLAVRSSAAIEDGSEAAAPGLFASVLDVSPAEVARAIEEVRASAEAPGVRAYLDARGLEGGRPRLAVLVQRQVEGVAGVAYTRPPGTPEADRAIVEVGGEGAPARRAYLDRGGALARDVDPGFPLAPAEIGDVLAAALAAEEALELRGGADVEWVVARGQVWVVQARPVVHRIPERVSPPPELFTFSRDEPDLLWRWDVTHNPDPLSPAQMALVERAAPRAPFRMRIVGGYLYTASEPAPEESAPAEPLEREAASLRALFFDRIKPRAERALAPLEEEDAPPLEDALAAYDCVFDLYAGELTPAVERARARVPASLWLDVAPEWIPPGDADLAAMAPAWDVAVPTFGERGVAPRPPRKPSSPPDEDEPLTALARLARAVADADDRLFFRAQAVVRRALLTRAVRLGLGDPEAIFFCDDPFGAGDPDEIAQQAAAGRERLEARRRVAMPLAFAGGHPVEDAPLPRAGDLWRGRGTGSRARGRVLKVGPFGALEGDGTVLVAQAVTPATVLSVPELDAVVCEHGGLLGHAAALARELGVPCVVGCRGAWRDLDPGEEIWVDGERGLVVRLGGAARSPAS